MSIYPRVGASWRLNWIDLYPFYNYSAWHIQESCSEIRAVL